MDAHCLCSSSGPRASHTELLPAPPGTVKSPPKMLKQNQFTGSLGGSVGVGVSRSWESGCSLPMLAGCPPFSLALPSRQLSLIRAAV